MNSILLEWLLKHKDQYNQDISMKYAMDSRIIPDMLSSCRRGSGGPVPRLLLVTGRHDHLDQWVLSARRRGHPERHQGHRQGHHPVRLHQGPARLLQERHRRLPGQGQGQEQGSDLGVFYIIYAEDLMSLP